jgi:hypothetical protein
MLTDLEKKLIVSALAFSSTEDVIADFTKEEELAMSELAVKLREEYCIDEVDSVYLPYKTTSDLKVNSSNLDIVEKYTDFIHFD